jgi:uncharacterized protein YndB with AHSA1/START domain
MRTALLILLVGVGSLGALAGVAAIIGARLPKEHVAWGRARYAQPPETVFAALADFTAATAWRADVKRIELLPVEDGRVRVREEGRRGTLPLEVEELVPPRRMVTRIADPDLPFGGRWIYEVVPDDGGSVLTITEEGEVHSPLFRFIARYVFGHHATLRGYLQALGRKFGEEVQIETGLS